MVLGLLQLWKKVESFLGVLQRATKLLIFRFQRFDSTTQALSPFPLIRSAFNKRSFGFVMT